MTTPATVEARVVELELQFAALKANHNVITYSDDERKQLSSVIAREISKSNQARRIKINGRG